MRKRTEIIFGNVTGPEGYKYSLFGMESVNLEIYIPSEVNTIFLQTNFLLHADYNFC